MAGRWQVALVLVVGVAGSSARAAAQPAPFEGVLTIRMSAKTAQGTMNQELEYLMRGGKVRVNLGAAAGLPIAGASMIMIPQENKLYMLMASQGAYMEMRLPDTLMGAASGGSSAVADGIKLVRTGRMETVAGLRCEHVQVMAKDGTTDMCVTREIGRFVSPADGMRRVLAPWQRDLGSEFPLKVTMPDGSVPLEVVKAERKRLSNDLFVVPGTYNKMVMPARPPRGTTTG
jgi:hypothetical protein